MKNAENVYACKGLFITYIVFRKSIISALSIPGTYNVNIRIGTQKSIIGLIH